MPQHVAPAELLGAQAEEGHDLVGELLRGAEALRVEHDLGDEHVVGLGHGQRAEELLEVVRQVGAVGVAWVHCDEDGHVRVDGHLRE